MDIDGAAAVNFFRGDLFPISGIICVQSLSRSTATHILVDEAQAATNGTYSLSSTFLSRGMYNNDPVFDVDIGTGVQREMIPFVKR